MDKNLLKELFGFDKVLMFKDVLISEKCLTNDNDLDDNYLRVYEQAYIKILCMCNAICEFKKRFPYAEREVKLAFLNCFDSDFECGVGTNGDKIRVYDDVVDFYFDEKTIDLSDFIYMIWDKKNDCFFEHGNNHDKLSTIKTDWKEYLSEKLVEKLEEEYGILKTSL